MSVDRQTLLMGALVLAVTLGLLVVVERTRRRALPSDLREFWSEIDEYRSNYDAFKEWLREHGRAPES